MADWKAGRGGGRWRERNWNSLPCLRFHSIEPHIPFCLSQYLHSYFFHIHERSLLLKTNTEKWQWRPCAIQATPCMNWSWRSTTNLIIVVAARKQASGLDTDAKNAILIFTKPIWLHMMHQILMNSFRVPPLNSLETHQNPAMRNAE